jgi:signal transduction histidine kinase
MKRMIQIAPKQLRALMVLMLILPLVPTGVLVRLLWEEQQFMTEQVAADVRHLSRSHLATALKATAIVSVSDGAALVDGLRRSFDPGVRFEIVDRAGRVLHADAGYGSLPDDAVSATYGSWEIRMRGAGADVIRSATGHSGPVWGMVVGLLAMTFLITGVAARAVTRRMRIEEIQGDSLAAISHELKTPVSSARVLLETLRDGDGEDRAKLLEDYLDLLLQENLRMGRLVENFLNHTRLEQHRQRFRVEAVEPARIVAEAVGQVESEIARRGGRLRCFGQGAGMPAILADAEAMTMVLVLLLENALKYSDGAPDIEIDFFPAGDRAYLLVKDRGIGVRGSSRRLIFEKFYQVDPKLSRRGGGCGLGLSIARHIVEAHGGEIRHERRRGKGSVFRIHVPAVEAPELRRVA